ncbi:MAG TPA: carboxypeptidase-like regulatory domain-containing protein, partial [Longimicrobium sp.]|nr:carboxypeptidase-like regulatory domain-containing protein [Longimicrobium sp.]
MITRQTADLPTFRKVRPALRLCALAALVLGGAAACERGLTSAPEGPVRNEVAAGAGAVAGRVLSTSGVAVPGARVSTPGGAVAVTGPGGEFVLPGLAVADRLPVTVSAEGFASTTAIYRVIAGVTVSREIRVLRRGPRVRIDAAAGGVVAFSNGGRVTIPPMAFAGVKPGEAVNVQIAYYDPAVSEILAAAPGDFAATEADGTRSQLQTSGMVDVLVTTDAGTQV